MSVTDDIANEIVELCEKELHTKELSREVMYDYLKEATTLTSLADEIEAKLKAKGISVGP